MEDAVNLVRPFEEEEEVKKVVFDSDGNKSSGPDGFTCFLPKMLGGSQIRGGLL